MVQTHKEGVALLVAATDNNSARRVIFNAALEQLKETASKVANDTMMFNQMSFIARCKLIAAAFKKRYPNMGDHHIAGMLGNFKEESGLRTDIVNGSAAGQKAVRGSGAVGLGQTLSENRFLTLLSDSSDVAKRVSGNDMIYHILSPVAQIQAWFSELEGSEKANFKKFLEAKDVRSAAIAWMKYIERPGSISPAPRIQAAIQILKILQDGY
jgi:hypothetical protein